MKSVPGSGTRPTTDRIKETLFNILQNDLLSIRFLDLYAGSGAIGIEALSRGAASACFVDSSRNATRIIRDNLAATHLEDQAEVMQCDVLKSFTYLEGTEPFQIIFMDPPYHSKEPERVLSNLSKNHYSFVTSETLIIIEEALNTDLPDLSSLGFILSRVKTYKTNKHIFLYPNEEKRD